ncbi:hypothetical protein LXL04_027217 [Taraxacum kok-saghyz]
MSSLSNIKVYRMKIILYIWLAEAKWYDHKGWSPLISSAGNKSFGVAQTQINHLNKPEKAVPLTDPTVLQELGVQEIICNIGSTELLPYHVVVFKAAHVYYGDVLEMADPRGFIQMAFLISLEGTEKYPTLTDDMAQMMRNLRKYALVPFLTTLSELVFPPMSNRVYNYSDVASNKEIGTALKMIKKEYPEVFSVIALINYVSINGVDSREAYPRVLMYDEYLEHVINTVAKGDKGFEVLEFSPHFRRRGTPRRSLNLEKSPSSPPGRKTVNARAYAEIPMDDLIFPTNENNQKEQGGPSKKKHLGERTEEAFDTKENFLVNIEKKIADQANLIDELITLRLEKLDEIIMIMQAQTSSKDYRIEKPLGADDESESSKLMEIIGILNQKVIEESAIDDARVMIVDFLEKRKKHKLAKTVTNTMLKNKDLRNMLLIVVTSEEKLLKEAKKFPWEDRLLHNNSKVRYDANNDLAALCESITDPKHPRIRDLGLPWKLAMQLWQNALWCSCFGSNWRMWMYSYFDVNEQSDEVSQSISETRENFTPSKPQMERHPLAQDINMVNVKDSNKVEQIPELEVIWGVKSPESVARYRAGQNSESKASILDWIKALDMITYGSPEQSVEGMKVVCHRLNDHEGSLMDDLVKDVDRLVSLLADKVAKAFEFCLMDASSRFCKYVLNTLMLIFQNKRLAHVVNVTTLDNLIPELLLWILDERVPSMNDGKQLLKALNVLMLKILDNAERTTLFVVLIGLLKPLDDLDSSKWPSSPSNESCTTRNLKFYELITKCLIKLTKENPHIPD